jgi:hypothetical protein
MVVPDPFDAPEALVAVWVQLNVAPAGVEVKFRAVELPEQTDVEPVMVAVGLALTMRSVYAENGLEHPLKIEL